MSLPSPSSVWQGAGGAMAVGKLHRRLGLLPGVINLSEGASCVAFGLMFERMCAELHLGAVGQLCPHTAWRLQGDALNLTLLNKLAQLLIGRTLWWLTRSTKVIYLPSRCSCLPSGTWWDSCLGGFQGGKVCRRQPHRCE